MPKPLKQRKGETDEAFALRCTEARERWREYSRRSKSKHRDKCREYSKRWRSRNRELANTLSAEWRKAHPEKRREYDKRYRETHREARREYDREYHRRHREVRKEYARRYYHLHRESHRIYRAAYYAMHREECLARSRVWRIRNAVTLYEKAAAAREWWRNRTRAAEFASWQDGGEEAFFDDLDARLGLHE